MNPGKISVSRVIPGDGEEYIKIALRTEFGYRIAVEISPEEFALALTGKSERPCQIDIKPSAMRE